MRFFFSRVNLANFFKQTTQSPYYENKQKYISIRSMSLCFLFVHAGKIHQTQFLSRLADAYENGNHYVNVFVLIKLSQYTR